MLLSLEMTIFLVLSIIIASGTIIAAIEQNDRLIVVSAYFSTATFSTILITPKSTSIAKTVPANATALGRIIQGSFSA